MRTIRPWAVLGLALPFCSCIDFAGQTLTYRYDRATDTLRMFIVYEAVNASRDKAGSEAPVTDEEKAQLESVVKGRRAFFFDNWISEFDREKNREELQENRRKLAEAGPAEQERLKADVELREALDKAVLVKNGRFYLNPKGQLCGWQYVAVSGVTRLLPLINKRVRLEVRDVNTVEMGERARQRLRAFAEKSDWVQVDGNQVRIRFVMDYDQFVKNRKGMAGEKRPFDFKTQDAVVNYDEPVVELILGRLDQEVTTLARPAEDKASGALVAYVKEKYGLVPMPDLEKRRADFIRDGKIPEE